MKLTKPQTELLKSIASGGRCSTTYKPALKLIELGLIEVVKGRFGDSVKITQKGEEEAKLHT